MSVQALGWVFDHSPAEGSDRLVLLSLANHAGTSPVDDAWEAYPGIALIQREAGLRRGRTVRDALTRLVEAGAVERIVNGAPDSRIRGDRRPNLYRILLDSGRPCDVPRCRWCGGTPDAERGDASRPDGGTRDVLTGGRGTSPEPSEEPSGEPEREPGALPLDVPAPSAPPPDPVKERAREIVTKVWERSDPKPATPFVGVVKIAERLLRAGHDAQAIGRAMLAVPTISTGWVEAEIKKSSGTAPSRRTPIDTNRDAPEGRIDL